MLSLLKQRVWYLITFTNLNLYLLMFICSLQYFLFRSSELGSLLFSVYLEVWALIFNFLKWCYCWNFYPLHFETFKFQHQQPWSNENILSQRKKICWTVIGIIIFWWCLFQQYWVQFKGWLRLSYASLSLFIFVCLNVLRSDIIQMCCLICCAIILYICMVIFFPCRSIFIFLYKYLWIVRQSNLAYVFLWVLHASCNCFYFWQNLQQWLGGVFVTLWRQC